jgi:methanogenic corrinoid protein MtbC1
MDDSARKLSYSLDAVAKALAQWTVSRHAETDPSLPQRYGDGWRTGWVKEVETRVRYLAQAIAVRRPKLFAETAAWSSSAFAARDAGAKDVETSLRCLREVIEAELPEAAARVALEHVDAGLERLQVPAGPPAERLEPGRPQSELALRYVEATLAGRHNDAAKLVLDAVGSGTSVSEIYSAVLWPALVEIGWMWHQGEISVADEHVASATTQMVMSMLRPHFKAAPVKGRRLVATAIRGELHALGLRMVADHFEMDGWDSIYLGANTPNEDVIRSLGDHDADLLAVSVTSMLHLRDVGELIAAVRDDAATSRVKIIVGGAPLGLDPDLWREIGADAWAPSAEAAVGIGNGLLDGTMQTS